MTKVSIEIEDVKDKQAWERALRKIFRAIEEHHGGETASRIFIWAANDPKSPRLIAEKKFKDARFDFVAEDLRLVLEYYAMPKPNKEKLATDLARKNETLPRANRYGPKGTTDPMTMLKQIKRVFLKHKEACGVIGHLDPTLRQQALQRTESVCKMHVELRAAGHRVRRSIPKNMRLPRR